MLPQAGLARRPVGAAAVAEERLEYRARIPLHRQRLRRAAPRDGVGVHAAQLAAAGAGVVRLVQGQLERRYLRLVRVVPGQQLVHRHVGDDLHLVAAAAVGAGQEGAGGAGVDVVPVRLEARQHEQLLAVRRQRLEDGRQLEAAPFRPRRPVLHGHAVGHVERLEAVRRPLRGVCAQRERRHHRVQQRQPDGCPQASQNGPPRQRSCRQKSHGLRFPRLLRRRGRCAQQEDGAPDDPVTSDDQR